MAKVIHTRRARYIPVGKQRNRTPRFKTFLTQEAAEAHAKFLELTEYTVARSNHGLSKKFKIVLN
jgi:hypothetical protein